MYEHFFLSATIELDYKSTNIVRRIRICKTFKKILNSCGNATFTTDVLPIRINLLIQTFRAYNGLIEYASHYSCVKSHSLKRICIAVQSAVPVPAPLK